jgi:hypothetical protein
VELALIIWGLFGLASGIVAGNRGANGCSWAVIGFILGPLGLLLAFTATGKKCRACAKKIPQDASVCAYCRTPVVIRSVNDA